MKKLDFMMKIERWLVQHDFNDIEMMRNPSQLENKDLNAYIREQRSWVEYKDKTRLAEFDEMVREHKKKNKN